MIVALALLFMPSAQHMLRQGCTNLTAQWSLPSYNKTSEIKVCFGQAPWAMWGEAGPLFYHTKRHITL